MADLRGARQPGRDAGRGPPGPPRVFGARRRLAPGWLRRLVVGGIAAFGLAAGSACGPGGAAPVHAPSAEEKAEQDARALLAPAARLPARAEVVAIADAVAIASSKRGATGEGARLAILAGDLRARLWRLDRAEADAREAFELYAAAARALGPGEASCQADRRRAGLAVELAGAGPAAFREIYLTLRRQEGVRGEAAAAGELACLGALELALARAGAYRPEGDAMRALEREGDAVAATARVTASASAAFLAGAPSGRPAASAASAAPGSAEAGPRAEGDVVSPAKAGAGPVRIRSIEKFGTESAGRVVVHLSGPTTFEVGALPGDEEKKLDPRIYVDVDRATSKGVPETIEVGGAVRRVRVGKHKGASRVVLDLSQTLRRRVFYLPDPFRIVIDVSTRELAPGAAVDAGGPRAIRRIAIDPGHGGSDDGAVGPTGLKEKEVTLDVAHRVAPLLAHELKVETLLTRDSDAFVPLDLRAARANAFHADLFVSIHCNASETGTARGVQTFVLDPGRVAEQAAARLAARENGLRVLSPLADPARVDTEVALIVSNLQVAELIPRSRHLAELLQRAAVASISPRYPDVRDQGVKTAGFYVLAGADMPAVLFETSFISNPEEESRLALADYRQKLADAIVNAIRAYRDGK